jgi:hypothetical protein
VSKIDEMVNGDVPPVDAEDLRAIWSTWTDGEATTRDGRSFSEDFVRAKCGANANVWAVWIRTSVLQVLVDRDERFRPLTSNPAAIDKLIGVMSTIPIKGMSVDPDEVLRRVQDVRLPD